MSWWLIAVLFAAVQAALLGVFWLVWTRLQRRALLPAGLRPSLGEYTATLKNYGGDPESEWNGVPVRVGRYLDKFGFFEVEPLDGSPSPVYVKIEELRPADARTAEYLKARGLPKMLDPVYYGEEVYDLRDLLDQVGVHVTAAAVAEWTPSQRASVRAYAVAARETPESLPKMPKELL